MTEEQGKAQEVQPIDEQLQKFVDKLLYAGGSPVAQSIRNFLNGTWLGEPLHVVLTDVPIGAWTVAMIFDAVELARHERGLRNAADASIAIGLAGAVAAAMTGWADWSDVDPPARTTGMYHGLMNLTAAALFASSLVFRRKRMRTRGRVYSMAGYTMMLVAAKLGGQMVYKDRVGVDRTAGQTFPEEFTAVLGSAELPEGKPTRAEHNGVPILLVRRGTRMFALAETCSHFGGPLSEGKLEGDSIVCPWHQSRFSLENGQVIDGPAVHPQPCLEARERDGKIEVRKAVCSAAAPFAAFTTPAFAGQK